jgi:hypothetical protein
MGRGGRLAVALLLTLLPAGCSAGVRHEPPALGLSPTAGDSVWGFSPGPGEVVMAGLAPLSVRSRLVLKSASLEMAYGRLDLLATRVTIGAVGSGCSTGPWPPAGYGSTSPIEGLPVEPGTRPTLVVYLRPVSAEARSAALLVTYTSGGHEHTLRIPNEHVEVAPPDPGQLGDRCLDAPWFR